ncbi:MAG: FAD-dependent oxidoreductase [Bacteroidota bacterium]
MTFWKIFKNISTIHTHTQIDYIIVGQGLTGTLLAHSLLEKGKTINLVDNHHVGAASKVAAGVINPVTGRRFVKSWLVDELIPFAKTTYQKLEQQLGVKFFHQKNILRVLFSIKDENKWLEKTADPTVSKYLLDTASIGNYLGKIDTHAGIGETQHTAQVNMKLLLEASRIYFEQRGLLTTEKLDYDELKEKEGQVSYKGINAKKVIFCEGQQGRQNPWFGNLPFEVAKGEVLLVKIPTAHFEKMLKHSLFIIPLQNDLYWVGSTYDWDCPDDLPTEEAKQLLIHKLKKVLKVPFEVVDHLAAIRPATFDRRPFVGFHPEKKYLGIINGMGTKGASLAPYFVNQFVALLLDNQPVNPQASVDRFLEKS